MKLNAIDVQNMTLGDLEYFERESGSTYDDLAAGRINTRAVLALIVLQERKTNPRFGMDDARLLRISDIEFEQPPAAEQADPTTTAAEAEPTPSE